LAPRGGLEQGSVCTAIKVFITLTD
jgi:hypothetical protein